jgi:hypothetical protein
VGGGLVPHRITAWSDEGVCCRVGDCIVLRVAFVIGLCYVIECEGFGSE